MNDKDKATLKLLNRKVEIAHKNRADFLGSKRQLRERVKHLESLLRSKRYESSIVKVGDDEFMHTRWGVIRLC